MTKEFNLSEKRKEVDRMLVKSGLNVYSIKLIHDKIKKQDKEFIKLLKEKNNEGMMSMSNEFIDKLAGKELT